MANTIQLKRGDYGTLPTLLVAELGFSTDQHRLHIGDGTKNYEAVLADVATDAGFPRVTSAGAKPVWTALDADMVAETTTKKYATAIQKTILNVLDDFGFSIPSGATLQVETATVIGTITTAGNATVIITGFLVTGTPLTVSVAVALNDTASLIAGKIRTALNIAAITDNYTVSGATDKVILTAKLGAANDTSLNIDIKDGTSVGITANTTSANSTAGIAPTLLFGGNLATTGEMQAWSDTGLGLPQSLLDALPIATNTTLGIMKPGSGLNIASGGIVDVVGGGTSAIWGQITGTLSDQTNLQNALDLKEDKVNKDAISGYAGLDTAGKINPLQLPAIAISDTFVVATEAAMLALTAQVGDIAVRTDINKSYILRGTDPTLLADWEELRTPTDAVQSVFGRSGTVTSATNDYTWAQIDKTVSDLANITTRNFSSLQNKPTTVGGYGITDFSSLFSTDFSNKTLNDLGDATITTNSAGEILKWNGTAWVNNTLAEALIMKVGVAISGGTW